MTKSNRIEYFKKTLGEAPRHNTVLLSQLVPETCVVVDCGCGSGNDSVYLAEQGFLVYAFDKDLNAIKLFRTRDESKVINIKNCSFESYQFPKCDLILAHSSLYYCKSKLFPDIWSRMVEGLNPGGFISFDLLGDKDSWVNDECRDYSYFNRHEVERLIDCFSIVNFEESYRRLYKGSSKEVWHTYTIIAQKR